MPLDANRLRCSACGEFKAAEEFAWRRRERQQRDCFCRRCRAAYGRAHYQANRRRYIEQATRHKQRLMLDRTRWLIEYFRINPCADCGESDPIVLEFDHLRDKSFAIGPQLSQRSWTSILAEIEKCEVVCANCHRRRTARRRGTVRALLATT
jgi:hypothetical protein